MISIDDLLFDTAESLRRYLFGWETIIKNLVNWLELHFLVNDACPDEFFNTMAVPEWKQEEEDEEERQRWQSEYTGGHHLRNSSTRVAIEFQGRPVSIDEYLRSFPSIPDDECDEEEIIIAKWVNPQSTSKS